MQLKEFRIILDFFLSALFFVLLMFPAFGSSSSESISATFTLHIPVIQELSMSTAPGYTDQVQVKEKKEAETRTTISLDGDHTDLTEGNVLLEDALEVEVLSNVNWKLVASVEGGYLNYSGLQLSTSSRPDIWAKRGPQGFIKLTDFDKEFASGKGSFQELKEEFEISYKIGLSQKEGAQITGAGAEIRYTLMQL